VVLAVALFVLGASFTLAPATPADAATACRTVGGSSAAADGQRHATVVVDTGSGPVWSACISFPGTVNGIEAIDLAKDQIPDLDPVYDTYAGEGRAVCQLRGVGNDPPGCLGKTAAYWNYFRNGRYASTGAGSVTVSDGDVEGWRWGTGGGQPRAATAGTEAATASVPSTRPPGATASVPSTRPPATTPQPVGPGSAASTPTSSVSGGIRAGGQAAGGGLPVPPGSPGSTVPGAKPTSTSQAPAAPTTAIGGSSTTAPGGSVPSPAMAARSSTGRNERAGTNAPSTSGSSRSITGAVREQKPKSSGAGSAAALAVLLLVAAGGGVLLRKRRRAAADPPPA
jgi:hypothetical protein